MLRALASCLRCSRRLRWGFRRCERRRSWCQNRPLRRAASTASTLALPSEGSARLCAGLRCCGRRCCLAACASRCARCLLASAVCSAWWAWAMLRLEAACMHACVGMEDGGWGTATHQAETAGTLSWRLQRRTIAGRDLAAPCGKSRAARSGSLASAATKVGDLGVALRAGGLQVAQNNRT